MQRLVWYENHPCSGLSIEFLILLFSKVFFDATPVGVSLDEIISRAEALPNPIQLLGSRLVVHIQTSQEAVEDLLTVIRTLAEEKRAAGFVKPEKREEDGVYVYKDVYVRKGRNL